MANFDPREFRRQWMAEEKKELTQAGAQEANIQQPAKDVDPRDWGAQHYAGVYVPSKDPAESTPKVRWWNKLKDGAGNAIGEWFSNR